MRSFSMLVAVLALGLTLTTSDAEAAKRLGSGGSAGMQRQMTTPSKPPVAAPTQSPSGAAAQAAPGKRSWMGPVAGLAAGLGLAALASHLGFGEELASMMMIGLLVMAVLMAVGFFMRRRAGALQPNPAGAGGLRYAAAGPAPDAGAPSAFDPAHQRVSHAEVASPATAHGGAQAAGGTLPADFDAVGFARQARVNFIRLQAANDAANLDDLREFTTPEMFAEIKTDILARNGAIQKTDVVEIHAEVIEVVEEASRYVASVRFSGLLREERDADVEEIDEIWHLVKARAGHSGWVLAGIQQAQ